MSSIVLIAPPSLLPALKEHPDFKDAAGFADSEALRALEHIIRQPPDRVLLEATFAETSRGTALVNRIKADPALAACAIQLVQADGTATGIQTVRAAGSAPSDAAQRPLKIDQHGTRRAPRLPIDGALEVLVDGNPATLVNMSTTGAQVISPTILRPNQRVRVWLPDPVRPIRFSAIVAWAAFEMPPGKVHYRAGLEFFDADPDVVAQFIDIHKQ